MILNDSIKTDNFSAAYPGINKYMMENAPFQKSRVGDTKEILDFKTTITNPYKRCVGNNGRNINVFFLLAEAMWIFAGKKDVETLDLFNSQMKEYSDDGKSFNAPYGFRIRHAGISSFEDNAMLRSEENSHGFDEYYGGRDQLLIGLKELEKNPESRQVVLQIWNQQLDLGAVTKDKPCNDLVMLKVRENKLITTIANRSNDLHWGLPTNVFQFSFISEICSLLLGIEMGTQTHNSQSLHFYLNNPIADNMYENLQFNPNFVDLYTIAKEKKIQFSFTKGSNLEGRLEDIDFVINKIISSFLIGKPISHLTLEHWRSTLSPELVKYHDICHIFLSYKKESNKTDKLKASKIEEIYELSIRTADPLVVFQPLDIEVLAQNFFYSRIKDLSVIDERKLFTQNYL